MLSHAQLAGAKAAELVRPMEAWLLNEEGLRGVAETKVRPQHDDCAVGEALPESANRAATLKLL